MWRSLLETLAKYKDGITTLLAVLVFFIGGFSYFDSVIDKRIKNALDLLERREDKTFVDARTVLIRKWLENKDLREKFSKTEVYTEELIMDASKQIFEDADYRTALFNLATYYNNAAACTLDGLCDGPTMCASLMGEIQDYLDVNRGYFVYATRVRKEDAKTLTLSMPEFVNYCDAEIGVRVFSRHDHSVVCQVNLYLERFIGFSSALACKSEATSYDLKTREQAEKLNTNG